MHNFKESPIFKAIASFMVKLWCKTAHVKISRNTRLWTAIFTIRTLL